MKAKQILSTIGTVVIVGAASTAGAALWTNVLESKVRVARERITRSKNSNNIDFKLKYKTDFTVAPDGVPVCTVGLKMRHDGVEFSKRRSKESPEKIV